MNPRPLTDERIRSAIDRRARGANEGDLRERIHAATAVIPQRRDWRAWPFDGMRPQRRTALTLSLALVLLMLAALIAVIVGSRINRTTPAPLGGLAYLAGGDLFVAGPGGESPRLVWDLPASEDQGSRQLVWIDRENVLLHLYEPPQGIHVVNVTTGARRLLDEGVLVALSPDRRLVAIAPFDDRGPRRVKVVEIASGAIVGEILVPIFGYPPSWSPDGRSFLGESMETVYRVDIASAESTDLATGLCCGLSPHYPTWYPDGTRVVYVDYHPPVWSNVGYGEISRPDCGFRCGTLWTVAAAGGEPTRLTEERGSEILPVVSPDGRWVAYIDESIRGVVPERGRLMVIAADGSGAPLVGPDSMYASADGLSAAAEIRWDPDSTGITFLSPAATLWHVSLNGMVATQIEAPQISEFARQVLP